MKRSEKTNNNSTSITRNNYGEKEGWQVFDMNNLPSSNTSNNGANGSNDASSSTATWTEGLRAKAEQLAIAAEKRAEAKIAAAAQLRKAAVKRAEAKIAEAEQENKSSTTWTDAREISYNGVRVSNHNVNTGKNSGNIYIL